jgi:hypothetical protein
MSFSQIFAWWLPVRAFFVWGFCACKPRKPRKPISLPSRPRKKAQNPTFPCKKGLSGRGRGVTNKKQNFTSKTQNPKKQKPKKRSTCDLVSKTSQDWLNFYRIREDHYVDDSWNTPVVESDVQSVYELQEPKQNIQ